MKKIIAIVLAATLMLSVTACSSTAKKEKLTIATEPGFAPYEYYEGEKIVGIDIDIAAEIAKDMGRELEIKDMPFDSVLVAAETGKCDFGAAGISVTEERQKSMDFSIEYTTSKQVVVVLEDSEITDPTTVIEYKTGVQTGTTAHLYLTDSEVGAVEPKAYVKYLEAVSDLNAGRIDAIVMDSLPAQNLIQSYEGLKILDGELFTDVYAFAIKKGNTEMVEAINKTLSRLLEEGKIEEFTQTHMDKQMG